MRVDTTTSNIQVQLANTDTHSSDTEISETQDTRTVGNDEDLRRSDKLGSIFLENLRNSVLCLRKSFSLMPSVARGGKRTLSSMLR